VVLGRSLHRPPGVPGDLEDDKRDDEADERVGDGQAERNNGCACNYTDRHEPVNASMIAVGHKSRAMKLSSGAEPHLGGDLVSNETDHACRSQQPQVRERAGIDEITSGRYPGGGLPRVFGGHSRTPGPGDVSSEWPSLFPTRNARVPLGF
jgi:hypothetical protein